MRSKGYIKYFLPEKRRDGNQVLELELVKMKKEEILKVKIQCIKSSITRRTKGVGQTDFLLL